LGKKDAFFAVHSLGVPYSSGTQKPLSYWILLTAFRRYDPTIIDEGVDKTRIRAIARAHSSNNGGCFLEHGWQICLSCVAHALPSRDKSYRETRASGNAETATKAFEPIIFEFAPFEVAGSEDTSFNASTTPYTLLLVLLGNEPGCEDLGCYSMAKKSSQCVAAAGTAAAYYRSAVAALHRVSHMYEAGLVASSQTVERLFERGLMRVIHSILGDVVFWGIYVYAYVSWGVAIPFVSAAAAVLKDDSAGLSQDSFHFAEVEHPVVCVNLDVYRDRDGALEFASLGSELIVCAVSRISLPHSGGHDLTRASGEI
jgi:hypothetical protein